MILRWCCQTGLVVTVDQILKINRKNPEVTVGRSNVFKRWSTFALERDKKGRVQLNLGREREKKKNIENHALDLFLRSWEPFCRRPWEFLTRERERNTVTHINTHGRQVTLNTNSFYQTVCVIVCCRRGTPSRQDDVFFRGRCRVFLRRLPPTDDLDEWCSGWRKNLRDLLLSGEVLIPAVAIGGFYLQPQR